MIVDRYLLREVATPFIAITFALTTLYVTFSLTRYLTDATEGLLAAEAVFTLTMLRAVIALEMLLPVALYIGLMVALGRFYSDWEITAMKASGISERRIILPILAMAGLVGLMIAALTAKCSQFRPVDLIFKAVTVRQKVMEGYNQREQSFSVLYFFSLENCLSVKSM